MDTKTVSSFNIFLMLVLITFWGSSFVVVKIALNEGLSPFAIATYRFLIAGGLFSIIILSGRLFRGGGRNIIRIVMKDFGNLLLLSLSGVTFFFAAQYKGIQLAGAAIAAILVCLLSPILITVLSARIFKENLTRKQIFGIGIAAAGTLVVITGGTLSLQTGQNFYLGTLILLATPVLWALYSLLGKKIMEKYDPFLVVAYVNLLGGLCLIPFSIIENSLQEILTLTLNSWIALLYLSVTCSLLGYYIWFYVLKQVGAGVTSSFLFVEPLITTLFAVTLVGEEPAPPVYVGALLIFVGVYLVTRKRRRNTRAHNVRI